MEVKVFEYLDGSRKAIVVAPQGEIDSGTTNVFSNAMLGAVQSGCKMVVVDLVNVEHINSAGVAILARAYDRLGRSGCQMCLCRPNSNVNSFLETVGISSFVRVIDGLEEIFTGNE